MKTKQEKLTVLSATPEQTAKIGGLLAGFLEAGSVLALVGDLGAGKTTFVSGLVKGLGIQAETGSPTFTILQEYEGGPGCSLYHFDAYRLADEAEFVAAGLDAYLNGSGICAIEWPQRIASLLPDDTIEIDFQRMPSLEEAEWDFSAEKTIELPADTLPRSLTITASSALLGALREQLLLTDVHILEDEEENG